MNLRVGSCSSRYRNKKIENTAVDADVVYSTLQLVFRSRCAIACLFTTGTDGWRSDMHRVHTLLVFRCLQNLVLLATFQNDFRRPVGPVPAGLATGVFNHSLFNVDDLAGLVDFLNSCSSDLQESAHRHGIAPLSLILLG